MIKILSKTPASAEFKIKCLTPAALESTLPEFKNLEAGEWVVQNGTDGKAVVFCISTEWNDYQTAHHFRVMAFKTKKLWPAEVQLVTELKGDALKAALRGLFLCNYRLKPSNSETKHRVYIQADNADAILSAARAEAETQMWVMEMVDLPPNDKTPEQMGDLARESAKKHGYQCEVWNKTHIVKAGLNALYAVGRGSANDPVFIICKYYGRKDDENIDLALVGKGITFDSGGISIKPSTNMHYMKCDMAGAAAMLGTIELAAKQKAKLNIAVIVPSAENSVDANSLLPGEIIHSYSGKTIEVIDTDAEGRLVLCDGLAWTIKNLKPAVIIDMATLTGSSVRTLGDEAGALFSNNEKLAAELYDSGQKSGEKLWQLPLWKEYDSYMHSDVADIRNLSLKPVAGSITAAKFLEFFTEDHAAWAHIDMPGMSFKDSPFYKTKSATGYGVQILIDFVQKLIKNSDLVF